MSFSGRTPESLLPRSDSKHPATTCKGITSNGRPCRRALAASPYSSPVPSSARNNGVLAVLNEDTAAAFYCWQHKDQAENLAAQPEQRTILYPLKERSSIDTLIDRVGVLNLDEELPPPNKVRHRRKRSDEQHLTRRDTLPSGWHSMPGPLMTVPEVVKQSHLPKPKEYKYGRSNVKASWTCCIQEDDEDPPPRPRPRPQRQSGSAAYTSPSPMKLPTSSQDFAISPSATRRKPVPNQQPQMAEIHGLFRPSASLTNNQSNSQTQTLLSLIPPTLSPQTTSALLAELSRPISPHDESGYIYIFWLTPDSDTSKPDDETASSLLDDDDDTYPPRDHSTRSRRQRTSTALQRYASTRKASSTEAKTILLKIGRAANVHRRMTQWTKQCGQNITLIRYYPHNPSPSYSTTTTTPPATAAIASAPARKVPHVHRVERLIHLELSEKRAQKGSCEKCGREHKEWFEVDASRSGLKGVDAVVRRWGGWAESVDVEPEVVERDGGDVMEKWKKVGKDGSGRGTNGLSERAEVRDRDLTNGRASGTVEDGYY